MLTTRSDLVVVAPQSAAVDEDEAIDFDDFYADGRDRIAAALALTFRSPTLGAEAADEAMARALLRWPQVSVMDNPAGWVYRVGLNWGRSFLRRSRRETFAEPDADAHAPDDHPFLDPDLDAALATLDLRYRSVVVLRYLLEYSARETAEALGISEGTVKSRLSRALLKLRTELDDR